MNHFIGYLSSWSPYAAYRSTHPDKEDPLIELKAQFKCAGCRGAGGRAGGARAARACCCIL